MVTIIAPGAYTALSPFRVCDTRAVLPTNQCTAHTLGTATSIDVHVTGKTGPLGQTVPADALAVALNVTALSESTTNSFISVFPAGEALPKVSNISFDAGATQANLVVVRLAVGGDASVFNAVGRADVVVDVEGYFAPPGPTPVAGEYHTMPPLRICDTRAGKGTECAGSFDNPLPANTWRDVVLSGLPSGAANNTPSIPTQSAAAAVFNLTAVNGTQATYVTVASPNLTTDACPTKPPAASNLNPPTGSALPTGSSRLSDPTRTCASTTRPAALTSSSTSTAGSGMARREQPPHPARSSTRYPRLASVTLAPPGMDR